MSDFPEVKLTKFMQSKGASVIHSMDECPEGYGVLIEIQTLAYGNRIIIFPRKYLDNKKIFDQLIIQAERAVNRWVKECGTANYWKSRKRGLA